MPKIGSGSASAASGSPYAASGLAILGLIVLGTLWLFGAFAAFYVVRPFHFYFVWLATHTPAWVLDLQRPWQGVQWEVVGQGALTLTVGAVALWLGRELWPRLVGRAEEDALGSAVWGGGMVLGLWGTVIFLLGLVGAWHWPQPVFAGLFAGSAVLAVGVRLTHFTLKSEVCKSDPSGSSGSSATRAEWLLALMVAAIQAIVFLYAMTPGVQSDGLRYHLAAPQEWLKAGWPVYLPYNAFSDFTSTVEMLFLAGLGLAGDLFAKGFHFLFLPLTTLAVALLTRELYPGDGSAAGEGAIAETEPGAVAPPASTLAVWRVRPWVLAAVVWGTLPPVTTLGGWEFIDLALVFFTLGVVHFLVRWLRTDCAGDWVAAALFGGLLVGSKYTGVLTVAFGAGILVLGGVWRRMRAGDTGRESLRRIVTRAMAFGLIGAAFGVPWWTKNIVYTHNPVYPLAYSLFGGGGDWTKTCADIYAEKLLAQGTPRTALNFLKLPWNTAAHSQNYEGFDIGPFFWVLAPWVLAWLAGGVWHWRRRPGEVSLALWTAFLLVTWFFTYQSNRFLLPVLALATVAAALSLGCGVDALRSSLTSLAGRPAAPWPRGLCAAGVALPIAYGSVQSAFWLLFDEGQMTPRLESGVHWPAYTLGFTDRDAYLTNRLPRLYAAARYANATLTAGQKVLLVGEHGKFHWRCAVEGNDLYDSPRILPFLKVSTTADEALDAMAAAGFTEVFLNLEEWGWPTDASVLAGTTPPPRTSPWWYHRRHFTQREVDLLAAVLRSPRLEPLLVIAPGRVWLARIRP